jgi:hypothetical protein
MNSTSPRARGRTDEAVYLGYAHREAQYARDGSRYFFICAYLWLERYFSQGDYRRGK